MWSVLHSQCWAVCGQHLKAPVSAHRQGLVHGDGCTAGVHRGCSLTVLWVVLGPVVLKAWPKETRGSGLLRLLLCACFLVCLSAEGAALGRAALRYSPSAEGFPVPALPVALYPLFTIPSEYQCAPRRTVVVGAAAVAEGSFMSGAWNWGYRGMGHLTVAQ